MSNTEYAMHMMKDCDILCMQEHWLLNYESHLIDEIFPDCNYSIKCVDDGHPDLPMQRRRGSAGVVTLWKRNMDQWMEAIPDGSDRILAVIVSSSERPLLIINSYMPTMGSKDPDYGDTLDEIHELLAKYRNYTVIWTGDLNADTRRNKNYPNDTQLCHFLHEQQLDVTSHQPDIPTYHHFNGDTTSRLDMFVEHRHDTVIHNVTTDYRHTLNTSSHDAVTATLGISHLGKERKETAKHSLPPSRVKWEKVDYKMYEALTERRLRILLASTKDLPVDVIAEQVNDILVRSAKEASPPESKRQKTRKRPWNPEMKPLVKDIKKLHYKFAIKRPEDRSSQDLAALKAAKKLLRRAQRQTAAARRRDIKTSIMAACRQKDKREFFKLVKKQRCNPQSSGSINFGHLEAANSQPNSWANYFEDLATPTSNDHFDKEHERHLHIMQVLHLQASGGKELPQLTLDDVQKYVKELKNGKAPDLYGVAAEHIKQAGPSIAHIILHICNISISSGKLPLCFKFGILSPLLKKGKSHKEPNNYRRITITSLIGKVIEKHMLVYTNRALKTAHSHLQFGFTEGCSPAYAAILLTEVLAEAKDSGTPMIVTFMDASKAFDVVDHTSMLNSLHEQGVDGDLWNLYSSMYDEIQSSVKWDGQLSRSFKEKQGIRQGGVSSPSLYICGRNKGLRQLDKNPTMYIGNMNVGALMVADDLAIMAKTPAEMQVSLMIAEHDAARERYTYNTDKTKSIIVNSKDDTKLLLNGKTLSTSSKEKHLGIIRNKRNDNSDTIQARIQDARRAAYSLMGAGLCGLNGSGTEVAILLYSTYIVPVMLYGLESLVLQDNEVEILEAFHRRNIRHILHLPSSTAAPALYLLSGCAPIKALLHIRALGMFRNIADCKGKSNPVSFINNVISRQIVMKSSTSYSWAAYIRRILHKYNLPSAYDILLHPPSANRWKRLIRTTVYDYWTTIFRTDAEKMSSLKYLRLERLEIGKLHSSLKGDTNQHSVSCTTIATKLLVRRYPLSGSQVSGRKRDRCLLCKKGEEDEMHFLLHCEALQDTRLPLLTTLLQVIKEDRRSVNPEDLVEVILNPHDIYSTPQIIKLCRKLVYKLHSRRSELLLCPAAHPPVATLQSGSPN